MKKKSTKPKKTLKYLVKHFSLDINIQLSVQKEHILKDLRFFTLKIAEQDKSLCSSSPLAKTEFILLIFLDIKEEKNAKYFKINLSGLLRIY